MQVAIESLAYGGDGVGHLDDGRAAFIPRTAPGDVATIELTEEHPRWVRGRAVSLEQGGPDRTEPPCPYFAECGGCSWQHVTYDAQLHWKRQAVVDALQRIGRIDSAGRMVQPCTPSPQRFGYRNKIELSVDADSRRLLVGFVSLEGQSLVEVDRCLLLPERASAMPKALRGAVRYLSGGRELHLSRVGLRVAHHTRDVEVALWGEPGPFPRRTAKDVISQAVTATSLVRVLAKGGAQARRATNVEVLAGKGFWAERLAGQQMLISAPSFFQTNTGAAELLIGEVLASLARDEAQSVLDAFAGAGTFTLPMAQAGHDVIAIESLSSAVRDLRRNLERNGLSADVVGGDVAREIEGLGDFDAVVVDPPRRGLAPPLLDALVSMHPPRLVYVSCDPATLARDSTALLAGGMKLERVRPFDLFPQTYHVESVALFTPTD